MPKPSAEGIRTGREIKIEYGYHHHKAVELLDDQRKVVGHRSKQKACVRCEIENQQFMDMMKQGAQRLANRMLSIPSYQSYAQKWPFDIRKNVLSLEALTEDGGRPNIVDTSRPADPLRDIIEREDADRLLEGLTDMQREIIVKTAEEYRPREIAKLLGHKDSARVRQEKYAALRELGVPVNEKKRRTHVEQA